MGRLSHSSDSLKGLTASPWHRGCCTGDRRPQAGRDSGPLGTFFLCQKTDANPERRVSCPGALGPFLGPHAAGDILIGKKRSFKGFVLHSERRSQNLLSTPVSQRKPRFHGNGSNKITALAWPLAGWLEGPKLSDAGGLLVFPCRGL